GLGIRELERGVAENAVCGKYRRPIFQVSRGDDLAVGDWGGDEGKREGLIGEGQSQYAWQAGDAFGEAIIATAERGGVGVDELKDESGGREIVGSEEGCPVSEIG